MQGSAEGKPRVLIADDERVIADTMALILGASGWTTTVVYSGEAAVETAPKFKPDVLISDVVMGGLNGIAAAIQIQQMCPECQIVLISGQALTADLLARAGAPAAAFEVLAKPVHPSVLLDRLKQMQIPAAGKVTPA